MSGIDWTLIVGYPLGEALEYLQEEEQEYKIIFTAPPKKRDGDVDLEDEDVRIIGIRSNSDYLELICGASDWSIS